MTKQVVHETGAGCTNRCCTYIPGGCNLSCSIALFAHTVRVMTQQVPGVCARSCSQPHTVRPVAARRLNPLRGSQARSGCSLGRKITGQEHPAPPHMLSTLTELPPWAEPTRHSVTRGVHHEPGRDGYLTEVLLIMCKCEGKARGPQVERENLVELYRDRVG